jgi:uncharacterized OsmC-like protein
MGDNRRSVELTRLRKARLRATNARGGTLEVGEGDDEAFSPVDLLLTAIAACTAMDVDYITAKRAEATRMEVRSEGEKIRDEHGNRLTDIVVTFEVDFPAGEAGDRARESLPRAVQRSNEYICTVSRTVEVGSSVTVRIVGR